MSRLQLGTDGRLDGVVEVPRSARFPLKPSGLDLEVAQNSPPISLPVPSSLQLTPHIASCTSSISWLVWSQRQFMQMYHVLDSSTPTGTMGHGDHLPVVHSVCRGPP
jgi:hypothetical protein